VIYKHQSTSLPGRLVRNKAKPHVPGGAIVVKSTVTDSGGPRTTVLRPGFVLVKKTADGLYYAADDAAADRGAAPSITGAGHVDGNGVIALVGNHGSISVTTATGTGTVANHVTDLNANAAFAAHYIASSSGGQLKILARGTGAEEWFYIDAATIDTSGLAETEANAVKGTDADYRVLEDYLDMLDETGSVADSVAGSNTKAGCYLEANLLKLTAEARATLVRRGSQFE
jgi:hypothetical protein